MSVLTPSFGFAWITVTLQAVARAGQVAAEMRECKPLLVDELAHSR